MKREKGSFLGALRAFVAAFARRVRANKLTFAIYALMGLITTAVIAWTFIDGQYESTFTAVLSLFLFMLPTLVEEGLQIKLPQAMEIASVLFVFCANILGEILEFYTLLPFWDDMLHYTSGFIFAAFGFSLVELFNRNAKFDFHLSPFFVSMVALCFAVTVGVVWEMFEFCADMILHTDMQKDMIVKEVHSALLNPSGQSPVGISGITSTEVVGEGGARLEIDGYLDIGLFDTMKDLFIDLLGAILFCTIGFLHMKHSTRGRIARQFIPRVEERSDADA